MATEHALEGLKELDATLRAFPAKLQANILRGGLRAGGVMFQKAAIARVPRDDGDLQRSLRVSAYGLKSGKIRVTVSAGDKKAYYAHMVEYGTAAHLIRPHIQGKAMLLMPGVYKNGAVAHPGTAPTFFMTKSYDLTKMAVLDRFILYVRVRIPKEFAKQGRT